MLSFKGPLLRRCRESFTVAAYTPDARVILLLPYARFLDLAPA